MPMPPSYLHHLRLLGFVSDGVSAAPLLQEEEYIPMRFTAAEVGALPSCFTLDDMTQDGESR